MADCGCSCKGGTRLLFACSGAADVGEISDLAARKMTRDGLGKMFCMAGIGGNVEGIVKTTRAADRIVAIDGCGLDCAKKSLAERGFDDVIHVRLTDLGLEKGKSPADATTIHAAITAVQQRLAEKDLPKA